VWSIFTCTYCASVYLERQKKNIGTLTLSGTSFSILAEKIRKISIELNCYVSRWDYRALEFT
jgi:hypothetical protein